MPPITLPTLTAAAVTDERQLWTAIDQFLSRVPGHRARQRNITRLQRKLRALVSARAWRRYLDVEAAMNECHVAMLIAAVRWAFEQGLGAVRRGAGGDS